MHAAEVLSMEDIDEAIGHLTVTRAACRTAGDVARCSSITARIDALLEERTILLDKHRAAQKIQHIGHRSLQTSGAVSPRRAESFRD